MRKVQRTPEWKLTYIRVNHAEKTCAELCEELELSNSKVLAYCKEQGIKTKPSEFHKKNRKPGTVIKGHPYVPRYKPEEIKKQRPPAVYSNKRLYDQLQDP